MSKKIVICEKLKDIIQDKAKIPLQNNLSHENTYLIAIKETDKNAPLKEIQLTYLSSNATFAFKLDCKKIRVQNKHKLSPYFKDGKDLDKGCDAVIFTQMESKWYIFIVELKSKTKRKGKMSEIRKQFKSSLCFVEYIKAILRIICEKSDLNKIQPRCILFSPDASNLRRTKGKSPQIIGNGINIRHLKCDNECCTYHIKSLAQ